MQAPEAIRRVALSIAELDCDRAYCERFKTEGLINKEVTFLNRTFKADYSENSKKTMEPLYRFNLYYFEYAVALGAEYQRTGNAEYAKAFSNLYEDYLSANAPLHPYVVSLHIPNLLIAVELFGSGIDEGLQKRIYSELYSQYKYLLSHFEKHLLANHYFENLKAAVIASYVFGEDDVCKKCLKKLRTQVREQVLPDGMHFELSPMYHKIILEDLLRIAKLSLSPDFPECGWLKEAVQKMLDAAASLEKGIGRTPLFNDSGDNVAKSTAQLINASDALLGIKPNYIDSFPQSGYYKLYDGDIAAVIDAGRIGPDYNPGHGHCDCLSFELSVNDRPLFVNSGTYHYQDRLRKYFRSTSAHNTLKIGGHEQSECWGEHRVARRINAICAEKDGSTVCGEYKNYLNEKHRRAFCLEGRALEVTDFVSSASSKTVQSYLHLAPNFSFAASGDAVSVFDKNGNEVCKILPEDCNFSIHASGEEFVYAPEFGALQKSQCMEFTWKNDNKQHGYKIIF